MSNPVVKIEKKDRTVPPWVPAKVEEAVALLRQHSPDFNRPASWQWCDATEPQPEIDLDRREAQGDTRTVLLLNSIDGKTLFFQTDGQASDVPNGNFRHKDGRAKQRIVKNWHYIIIVTQYSDGRGFRTETAVHVQEPTFRDALRQALGLGRRTNTQP